MDDLKMDQHASDAMVFGLVSRLERDGHHLTPTAVGKMHQIISDCIPDTRSEGTQKDLAAMVRERMDRDR